MISKLQLFSICSFLYVLLDPHKKFHIGKKLTKLNFLLFECGIILYMLTHVFNVSGIKNQLCQWIKDVQEQGLKERFRCNFQTKNKTRLYD